MYAHHLPTAVVSVPAINIVIIFDTISSSLNFESSSALINACIKELLWGCPEPELFGFMPSEVVVASVDLLRSSCTSCKAIAFIVAEADCAASSYLYLDEHLHIISGRPYIIRSDA